MGCTVAAFVIVMQEQALNGTDNIPRPSSGGALLNLLQYSRRAWNILVLLLFEPLRAPT